MLSEDSDMGVAVVDMFLAVKGVKENLNFLAKCNSDFVEKINVLNNEGETFRQEYKQLLESIQTFLNRMDEDVYIWNVFPPRKELFNASSVTGSEATEISQWSSSIVDEDEKSLRGYPRIAEDRSGKKTEVRQSYPSQKSGSDCRSMRSEDDWWGESCCSDVISSSNKERSFSQAMLASLLASLFWLQKKQKALSDRVPSSSQKIDKKLNLSASAVQMINNICEMAVEDSRESNEPSRSLEMIKQNDCNWSSGASCPSTESTIYETSYDDSKNSLLYDKQETSISQSEATEVEEQQTTDETSSGEHSEFEEALSDVYPAVITSMDGQSRKHGVTCMGDLTLKQTESTAKTNFETSWIRRLSSVITSKLMQRKRKKGRPGSSKKVPTKVVDSEPITPNNDDEFGEFRQIKRRFISETSRQPCVPRHRVFFPAETTKNDAPVHSGSDSVLSNDRRNSGAFRGYKNFCSEESKNSEQTLTGTETVKETTKPVTQQNKKGNLDLLSSFIPNPNVIRSRLHFMELKSEKPLFFNIQRSIPVYHGQVFVRKTPLYRTLPEFDSTSEESLRSSISGNKNRQEMVIEGSTSDLVIYIQVEVNDDTAPEEHRTFGTQTRKEVVRPRAMKAITLVESNHEIEPLYNIWRVQDLEVKEGGSEEPLVIIGMSEESIDEEEKVVAVREPKEKTVTFKKDLQHVIDYDEIKRQKIFWTNADSIDLKHVKQQVDVWFVQKNLLPLQETDFRRAQLTQENFKFEKMDTRVEELEEALQLIQEIENDTEDVKLDVPVSILPQLEMELRKHLQGKLKGLEELKRHEGKDSLYNFFSDMNFWSEKDVADQGSRESSASSHEASDGRLNNLLTMLSNLEEAVKMNENSNNSIELCEYNSSKIYELLNALTASIRRLEEAPNVASLSQTLDIASQLDTAVREYDGNIKKKPVEHLTPEKEDAEESMTESTAKEHLKGVRKRVFEIVQEEAVNLEGRVERDFERLQGLAKENDEALMFLETFLQKTERRVSDLESLKKNLKGLSASVKTMYEKLREKKINEEKLKRKQEVEQKTAGSATLPEKLPPPTVTQAPSIEKAQTMKENTALSLLTALDAVKAKAKEKNEMSQKILGSEKTRPRSPEPTIAPPKVATSSAPIVAPIVEPTQKDQLRAVIKEYKKVGDQSLYLSWTKPKGPLEVSVLGYQIYVNEKLNHKVRNPERLQAVLYSVDLTEETVVQLYAVTELVPKILLATIVHGKNNWLTNQ